MSRLFLNPLFFSLMAMAIGILGLALLHQYRNDQHFDLLIASIVWMTSGTLIGGGLLGLFGRPFFGAFLGFAFQLTTLMLFFLCPVMFI